MPGGEGSRKRCRDARDDDDVEEDDINYEDWAAQWAESNGYVQDESHSWDEHIAAAAAWARENGWADEPDDCNGSSDEDEASVKSESGESDYVQDCLECNEYNATVATDLHERGDIEGAVDMWRVMGVNDDDVDSDDEAVHDYLECNEYNAAVAKDLRGSGDIEGAVDMWRVIGVADIQTADAFNDSDVGGDSDDVGASGSGSRDEDEDEDAAEAAQERADEGMGRRILRHCYRGDYDRAEALKVESERGGRLMTDEWLRYLQTERLPVPGVSSVAMADFRRKHPQKGRRQACWDAVKNREFGGCQFGVGCHFYHL